MTIDLQFLALLIGAVACIKLARMLYCRWRGHEIPGSPHVRRRVIGLGLVVISAAIVALQL